LQALGDRPDAEKRTRYLTQAARQRENFFGYWNDQAAKSDAGLIVIKDHSYLHARITKGDAPGAPRNIRNSEDTSHFLKLYPANHKITERWL